MRAAHGGLLWLIICSTVAFGAVFIALRALQRITDGEAFNVLILFGIFLVTTWYAFSTYQMAAESREQRLVQIQPLIIQKALRGGEEATEWLKGSYFSHFFVWNSGAGVALELEISLLNSERHPIASHRETFLMSNEQRKFSFDIRARPEGSYYLVSEYKHFTSLSGEQAWDQTWLPFKLIKTSVPGEVHVNAGELEFKFRVSRKDRIDAFPSSVKPR